MAPKPKIYFTKADYEKGAWVGHGGTLLLP